MNILSRLWNWINRVDRSYQKDFLNVCSDYDVLKQENKELQKEKDFYEEQLTGKRENIQLKSLIGALQQELIEAKSRHADLETDFLRYAKEQAQLSGVVEERHREQNKTKQSA